MAGHVGVGMPGMVCMLASSAACTPGFPGSSRLHPPKQGCCAKGQCMHWLDREAMGWERGLPGTPLRRVASFTLQAWPHVHTVHYMPTCSASAVRCDGS